MPLVTEFSSEAAFIWFGVKQALSEIHLWLLGFYLSFPKDPCLSKQTSVTITLNSPTRVYF